MTSLERPLRIGLLGAANIAAQGIIEPTNATGARMVAMAARDRSRAESYAAEHGVERVLNSYEDVINDPEVNVIYNPLPNAFHAPWNIAALNAGKHVLTEKPFASNGAEAAAVRAVANSTGLVIMEGFHYLFHPVTARLHEVIASGEIGDIQRVEAELVIPSRQASDPRLSLELAGGALMDLGCYGMHAAGRLAPWAGGKPQIDSARGGGGAGGSGLDTWMNVELSFPNGAAVSVRSKMEGEANYKVFRVVGSKGELQLANFVQPHLDNRLQVSSGRGKRVERLGDRSSYTYQLEAFTAHLCDGSPLLIDADDAVASMELIDQCYKAAGFQPRPNYILKPTASERSQDLKHAQL